MSDLLKLLVTQLADDRFRLAEQIQVAKEAKARVATVRRNIKNSLAAVAAERALVRQVRKDAAEAGKAAVLARAVARAEKAQAQLEALRLKQMTPQAIKKANRKPGPVVIVQSAAA